VGFGPANGFVQILKKLYSNVLLCAQLFEFMKVAKLVVVQIMDFMKDERTFSTLTFMKTRLWNHLCEHLDLVVQMFAQLFYIVDTFRCHHNLDKGESQEGSSRLMCSSLLLAFG
jgi:hypothetical protein